MHFLHNFKIFLYSTISIHLLILQLPFAIQNEPQCTSFRLDQNGGSLEGVPVLDQGPTQTCYAHAGATLISAINKTLGNNSRPDPINLAFDSGMGNGGNLCGTINSAIKNGWCESERYSPAVRNQLILLFNQYKMLLDALGDPKKGSPDDWFKRRLYHSEHASSVSEEKKYSIRKIETQKILTNIHDTLEAHCIDSPSTVLDKNSILFALQATDEINFLDALKKGCEKKLKFPDSLHLKCEEWFVNKQDKIEEHFKDPGPSTLPLMIAYSSTLLFKGPNAPDSITEDFTGFLKNASQSVTQKFFNTSNIPTTMDEYLKEYGGHASLLIGRRINPNTNKCEYLIQNSWGSDCDGYYPKYNCESGKIWIPFDDLKPKIFYLSGLVTPPTSESEIK